MSREVDDGDVVALVAHVKSAEGIKSVSDELAEVKPPGVWVKVLGFTFDQAKGYTLNTQLVLIVADQNPRRSRKALIGLLNTVLTKVKPSGPVTARTVVTPETPAGLPGLVVPLDVSTVPS